MVIENDSTLPLPVSVQKIERVLLTAQVDLPVKAGEDLDARRINWIRTDDTFFSDIPEGYALFITDMLVSWHQLLQAPVADAPFTLVFVLMGTDQSRQRLMDLAGTGLPYSHWFATPVFFPAFQSRAGALGIARRSDARLAVTLTGYLEPIAQ